MSGTYRIDNAVTEISELAESLRQELGKLSNTVKEISVVTDNIQQALISVDDMNRNVLLDEKSNNGYASEFYNESIPIPTPIPTPTPTGNIIDNTVERVTSFAKNVQDEVNTSVTVASLKAGAGSGVDKAASKTTELLDMLPEDMKSSKAASVVKEKLQGKDSRRYFILYGFILIAVVMLILFVPLTRWIVLIVALAWLGLCIYKKPIRIAGHDIKLYTSIKIPIIVAAIALILTITLPSGSIITGGSSGSGGRMTGDNGNSSGGSAGAILTSGGSVTQENINTFFQNRYPDAIRITAEYSSTYPVDHDVLEWMEGYVVAVATREGLVHYFVSTQGRVFYSISSSSFLEIK